MGKGTTEHVMPAPPGIRAVGDFVPGWVQMTCPNCKVEYGGDAASKLCQRCATAKLYPPKKVP